jgi:hypothetical protein
MISSFDFGVITPLMLAVEGVSGKLFLIMKTFSPDDGSGLLFF